MVAVKSAKKSRKCHFYFDRVRLSNRCSHWVILCLFFRDIFRTIGQLNQMWMGIINSRLIDVIDCLIDVFSRRKKILLIFFRKTRQLLTTSGHLRCHITPCDRHRRTAQRECTKPADPQPSIQPCRISDAAWSKRERARDLHDWPHLENDETTHLFRPVPS